MGIFGLDLHELSTACRQRSTDRACYAGNRQLARFVGKRSDTPPWARPATGTKAGRWDLKMEVHGAEAGASEGRLVATSSQPIPTAPSTESAPFFTAEHHRPPVRRWRVEGRHALRADTMAPNGDDCAMRAWSPALACSKVAPVTLSAASLTRESSR